MHGFLTEVRTNFGQIQQNIHVQGDRSIEAVAVAARTIMNRADEYFKKFVSGQESLQTPYTGLPDMEFFGGSEDQI